MSANFKAFGFGSGWNICNKKINENQALLLDISTSETVWKA